MGRSRSQNLYLPGRVEGASPAAVREIQNLYDRVNYLLQEIERMGSAFPEMVEGAAKKEAPVQGVLTIPSTGYGGQNGFVRISKDGVIQSYANPTSIGSGAPKWFNKSSTLFDTAANTTETNFGTITVPPNTLANNEDFVVMRFRGFSAGNANNKRYRGYVNGTAGTIILDTGLSPYAGGWEMGIMFIRLSPVLLRCQEYFYSTNAGGALTNANINLNTFPFPPNAGGADLTIANLETTAFSYLVTGTNGTAADNDCTQNWQDAYVVNFF